MFNVGPTELIVILVLALLVFGPKRLPEMSRQIGRGLREFRRATQDVQNEIQGVLSMDEDDEPAASANSNGHGPMNGDAAGRGTITSEDVEQGAAETQVTTEAGPSPAPESPDEGSGPATPHTVIDPSGD